jgi:signal peptide peptidase SppA
MQQKMNSTIVAMEPRLWMAFLEDVRIAQDNKVVFAARSTPARSTPNIDVINISGVLLKTVPEAYRKWGLDATGYDEIAEAVAMAAQSKSERIILNISSGGGMVDGIDLALNALRAAKNIKPIHAYADGLTASAAYWIASTANNIFATRLTEVGSIGVYSVMYDASEYMKKNGIETVVMRSGNLKGAGIFGDKITDEMREVEQETVNTIAKKFFSEVSASRIEIDIDAVTTGRTWLAETAKELNLIDGIVKNVFDLPGAIEALSRAAQTTATAIPEPQPKEPIQMAEDHEGAVAAERERVMAISAAFADDTAFARKHIEAGSTLEAAKAAHYDILKARNEALAAMSDATPAPMKNSGEAAAQSAQSGYFARMNELMAERGITRIQAALIAEKENPEAYRKECFGGGN